MTFTAKAGVLDLSLELPDSFANQTSGLLGNFNDVANDDFLLPNETSIFTHKNATEREIYNEFGQKCKFFCLFYFKV